jgi:hypothetical protein
VEVLDAHHGVRSAGRASVDALHGGHAVAEADDEHRLDRGAVHTLDQQLAGVGADAVDQTQRSGRAGRQGEGRDVRAAGPAVDDVVAFRAPQVVVAIAALERVGSLAAKEVVGAAQTLDQLRVGSAAEIVGTGVPVIVIGAVAVISAMVKIPSVRCARAGGCTPPSRDWAFPPGASHRAMERLAAQASSIL